MVASYGVHGDRNFYYFVFAGSVHDQIGTTPALTFPVTTPRFGLTHLSANVTANAQRFFRVQEP
jgi:hypothetical protein